MHSETPRPQHGRREFLVGTAGLVGLGFTGLAKHVQARAEGLVAFSQTPPEGYGPPIPDPYGTLDLPEGFTYRVFSTWG